MKLNPDSFILEKLIKIDERDRIQLLALISARIPLGPVQILVLIISIGLRFFITKIRHLNLNNTSNLIPKTIKPICMT